MKKILVVWIIIAVLMVGGLTVIGFMITNKNAPYKALEQELKQGAQSYVGQYPAYITEHEYITSEDLISSGFLSELKVDDETCSGYVTFTSQGQFYKYKAYIKCNNYTTDDYKSVS